MKNDSLAEIIKENFLKDYAFLLDENWFDGEAPPQLLSGKLKNTLPLKRSFMQDIT